MKDKTKSIIFDLSGTLVKMRPPRLLIDSPFLKKIAKMSRLGIITGAKRSETLNVLRKLKILNYFNWIITKDDSSFRKPDKRLFKKIKYKIPIGRIIYVGDTKKDYLLAKNAGIRFCYVGKRKYGIYQNKYINKIINFIVKNILK